jgi:hypothetical protein
LKIKQQQVGELETQVTAIKAIEPEKEPELMQRKVIVEERSVHL